MSAGKLLCIGNLGAGKSSLCGGLSRALKWPHVGIDAERMTASDGTAAGEARAWVSFLSHAQSGAAMVLECSGGGPFVHLLRHALHRSGLPAAVVVVRTPAGVCLDRVQGRGLSVPYPDFGVPIEKVIESVANDLEKQLLTTWATEPRINVDGTQDVAGTVGTVLGWLERKEVGSR